VVFLIAMGEKRVKSGSKDFEVFFTSKEYFVPTEIRKSKTFRSLL